MSSLLRSLATLFLSMGASGLFVLGMLDSSFLFLPLGNDLLLIALTARNNGHWVYYVIMAATGSTLGVWFTAWVSRKGGEAGLGESRRVRYVKRQVAKNAGPALAIASLMPPPFPFTPFVIVAGALNYPVSKMLAIIGVCRAIRFTIEALLALHYGESIIKMAEAPWLKNSILVLVAVSIIGSVWSIWGWFKKSRSRRSA